MGRKKIKSNKCKLISDLTRTTWLEKDDHRSNWLNSVFDELSG